MSISFENVINEIYKKLGMNPENYPGNKHGNLPEELSEKINALYEADEQLKEIHKLSSEFNVNTELLNSFYKGIAEIQISSLRNVKTIYELQKEIEILKKNNKMLSERSYAAFLEKVTNKISAVADISRDAPTNISSSETSELVIPRQIDIKHNIGDLPQLDITGQVFNAEELLKQVIEKLTQHAVALDLKDFKFEDLINLKKQLKKMGSIYFVEPLVYIMELIKTNCDDLCKKIDIKDKINLMNMFYIKLDEAKKTYINNINTIEPDPIDADTTIYKKNIHDDSYYISVVHIIYILYNMKESPNTKEKCNIFMTICGNIFSIFSSIVYTYDNLKTHNKYIRKLYKDTFDKEKKLLPFIIFRKDPGRSVNERFKYNTKQFDEYVAIKHKHISKEGNKLPIEENIHYFGPYEKIFETKTNTQMAEEMNKMSIFNDFFTTPKNPLCFVSFGQSGSGKTSSLIYLDKGLQKEKGIILQLFNMNLSKIKSIKVTFRDVIVNGTSFKEQNDIMTTDNGIKYSIHKYYKDKEEYKFEYNDIKETTINEMGKKIMDLMNKDNYRSTFFTPNNPQSSRSHLIILFDITLVSDKNAKVVVCDLAGFENKFNCEEESGLLEFENMHKLITAEILKGNTPKLEPRTYTDDLYKKNLLKLILIELFIKYFSLIKIPLDISKDFVGIGKLQIDTPKWNTSKHNRTSLWICDNDTAKPVYLNKDLNIETTLIPGNKTTLGNVLKTLGMNEHFTWENLKNILPETILKPPNFNNTNFRYLFVKDEPKINSENINKFINLFATKENINEWLKYIKEFKFNQLKDIYKEYCKNRVLEGDFINKSVFDLGEDIKHIVSKSTSTTGGTMIFPYLRNIMKDYWLNFNDIKSFIQHKYGAIAKAIYDVMKNEKGDDISIEKELNNVKWITWSVANVSDNVNNPPKIPYVNIDKIVYDYETLLNEPKLKNDIIEKLRKFESYNYYTNSILKSYSEKMDGKDLAKEIYKINSSTFIGSLEQGDIMGISWITPQLKFHPHTYFEDIDISKIENIELLETTIGRGLGDFNEQLKKYLKYKLKYLELKKQLKR